MLEAAFTRAQAASFALTAEKGVVYHIHATASISYLGSMSQSAYVSARFSNMVHECSMTLDMRKQSVVAVPHFFCRVQSLFLTRSIAFVRPTHSRVTLILATVTFRYRQPVTSISENNGLPSVETKS